MFKRILKIFSIVLLVAIAGVGVVVGVLFLQGKFKEPYVEPTSIYFDIENNTLDVTYYCNNLTTEGYTKSNVYSFVLKAKPSDVTELDCLMTTKSGSQLIEFCDKNGNPLNTNSLQSDIKIGERVYFKIKSSFDNTTENYANTNGEVKLEFISDNGLCNADLKIRIERQTSSVSLFDFNENTNNVHHNGKFDYEKVMYETIALTETPESWDGIFILDNSSGADVYLAVKEDAEWDATTVYYRAETKSDLEIEISANYEYELVPIYAPENSNKPFSNKDAKSTDIFIKNGDVFENIRDTSSNLIINRSGKYYFYSEQAGEFELYVISYPTYDYQQKFLDLELGSNENVIFNNPYAITRRVLVKVMNSGVQSVYFNDGNELLNINLDLFKENKLIVKNNSVVDGTINLNVNMFNSTGALVNSRYNQIEFLNNSHFVAGNINLYSSDGKQIIVRENVVNLSGFASAYNGTKNYQIEYESNSIRLTINSGDDQLNNIILLFNGAVEKNGLSRITFAGVENDESSWVCQNQIILINRIPFVNDNQTPGDSSDDTTEYKYSIGEFKVGSYLIFSNSSKNNVNNSFMISSSGYGKDKTFTIIPKEQLSEISLYMLVVNEDKTFVYTSQSAGISINYEETSLVADKLLDLKIKYYYEDVEGEDEQIVLSESSTIKVSDLVEFSEGTFNLPLMFVEASDAKVHTINQISYEKTYDGRAVKYCLVGTIDENGHFINEIIPKSNVIGEEEIYIMLLKYNYDTTSAEQIVDNILSKFKNQQSTSEAKVLNNIFYIGAPIEIGKTTHQITNIITTSTGIDVYYNDSAENSYVTVTDLNLFYNINEAELYKFYNSPTDAIVANIEYTEKINSEDESSVMDFKINLGDEGDLTEISEGESFNVSINLEGASNNANVLKLIADYYDNLGVLGLNNYFSLKILMINESNQVVQTGNIVRVSQEEVVSYSIDNTTISKYFAINNMFVDFDAEIGDILIIDVSVLNDSLDTFENFKFKFLFEYLEESATSNEFKIKSTAVQGYQWVVGETNYSFEEYYLIYNILWDTSSSNYTYSASLVLKAEYDDYLSGGATPTTIIELPTGSSLEDSNILANNIDVVNEGYNENEFDFTAVSNSNLISVLEGENENEYSLVLNGLGEVIVTLINTTKTNVESSFKVFIETNAISFASKNAVNNIEANNFVLSQGFAGTNNIFDFAQTLNESSIDLFNLTIDEQPIVNFRISNLTTGYVAVAKEDGFGVNVVESSNVSNIVVSLEYSSNRWQLIRQPNYVLTTLSFDLTAISLVGEVTTTINYLSPVKIEKNA
ncbi:MAG: hypothetical protein IJX26_04280, partial [Clostridia bacterium]|nr:hypothetical protein [Clostridia bacterium]